MVDRYYRKIESVENDIENAMQISSILLKLKEYDNKLDDLSKIEDNENNISSNLGIINTNEGNISSNLSKISNIENNLIIVDDIFNDTFVILRFSSTWSSNRIFLRIINSKFTTNGIIKIEC